MEAALVLLGVWIPAGVVERSVQGTHDACRYAEQSVLMTNTTRWTHDGKNEIMNE